MLNEIQLKRHCEKIRINPYEHRVRMSETDLSGGVHHSHYISWMEDARADLLEQIGIGFERLHASGIEPLMISEKINYWNKLKYGDTVVVKTRISAYDGHNMDIAYSFLDKKTGEDVAAAESRHCFVNNSGIPISLKRIYPELETRFFEFH